MAFVKRIIIKFVHLSPVSPIVSFPKGLCNPAKKICVEKKELGEYDDGSML